MPEFVVQTVVKEEPWSNDHGSFIGYEMVLEGLAETVTMNQKTSTAAPKPGDRIDGELKDGKRGKLLKKNFSQSGSGGSGDDFARRPEHPENVARMRHTSALSAAPAYYELLRTEGVLDKAESKAAALETLRGIIRWIEDGYPETPKPEPAPTQPDQVQF